MNKLFIIFLILAFITSASAQTCNTSGAENCSACTQNNGTVCRSCNSNAYLLNGKCPLCSTIHNMCTSCTSSDVCTKCSGTLIPSFSDRKACVECSSISDCTGCTNNLCSTCSGSKIPARDGQTCVTCATAIANCTTCSNASKCTTCATGYTLNKQETACVFAYKIAFGLVSLIFALLL